MSDRLVFIDGSIIWINDTLSEAIMNNLYEADFTHWIKDGSAVAALSTVIFYKIEQYRLGLLDDYEIVLGVRYGLKVGCSDVMDALTNLGINGMWRLAAQLAKMRGLDLVNVVRFVADISNCNYGMLLIDVGSVVDQLGLGDLNISHETWCEICDYCEKNNYPEPGYNTVRGIKVV